MAAPTPPCTSPLLNRPPHETTRLLLVDSWITRGCLCWIPRVRPVPVGVPRELLPLARGISVGGLTAERFVACPSGDPGKRMNRTGSMGCFTSGVERAGGRSSVAGEPFSTCNLTSSQLTASTAVRLADWPHCRDLRVRSPVKAATASGRTVRPPVGPR
jgi:hypothetical protein